MTFAAVSVLVILASGEPGDGSTRAMERALHAALVRDATVAVKAAPKPAPSDGDAAALATAEHADLVCVVTWSEHQRHATVRFTKLPAEEWHSRELRFEPADAANERGRTVGFALASMMPDEVFADAPQEKPVEPSPPRAPVPEPRVFADVPVRIIERPAPPTLPRENPLAIDAVAMAADAPDGYGGGIGGMVAVRVPLIGALGLHGGIGARAGAIGPAAATSHTVVGAAGLAWQPWLDARHRWAAGARVDALVVFLDVDHLDADDTEAKHLSRFLGGASALAEGTFRFTQQAALVAGAGTEVVFGRTDLFLHERKVASVLPAKLLAELGLRVSFP